MRMHIELEDGLVARVDEIAGARGRSAFVRSAIEAALNSQERWASLQQAAGALGGDAHEWDADPAQWVRSQRQADPRRAG